MQTLVAVVTTTPSMSVKSAIRYNTGSSFTSPLIYSDYQFKLLLQWKKDLNSKNLIADQTPPLRCVLVVM